MEEKTGEILVEVSKQIAKDAYNDAAKPIMNPTGQVAGLLPRAIKAALLPVEKWILGREYNLEETKKLLEQKLERVNLDFIDSPEPYIAVPALQYISYCMDSEELRDMYANLLANSMNKVVKNEVHPGFIEIIKQLSPDEAKILKEFYKVKQEPIIGVRYTNEDGGGISVIGKFSSITERIACENKYDVEKYLDNLERLGLVSSKKDMFFTNKSIYENLKKHEEISKLNNIPLQFIENGYREVEFEEGVSMLTQYGESFCKICINEE